MQTPPQATTATTNHPAAKPQLASLLTILEEVPDPRVTATVDHALADILTIALCTILCGGQSFYDMEEFGQVRLDWLKTFLSLCATARPPTTLTTASSRRSTRSNSATAWRAGRRACAACSAAKWWRWTARPCAAR